MYSDELPQGKTWPTFGCAHKYWEKAAKYIQETALTSFIRSGKISDGFKSIKLRLLFRMAFLD